MSTPSLRPTRRTFLTGTGLVIGFALAPRAYGRALAQNATAGGAGDLLPMNAYVKIGHDDTVTIVSKHLEWGQGIFTALATLVAEELDADWDQMRAVHAPVDDVIYANTGFGEFLFQGTFGSSGVSNSYLQYRQADAVARAMLVAAAAESWQVPAAEISVAGGVITHAPTGRQSGFGALVDLASGQQAPAEPTLKQPSGFRLIGSVPPRLDVPSKTTGAAVYTQDLEAEGMRVALVRYPDHFGATVKSFDDSAARAVPGVVDVQPVATGVAVYATDTWSAMKGRDALRVEWDLSAAETRSSAQLEDALVAALDATPHEALNTGDVEAALRDGAGEVTRSRIFFPLLAHAPMETMDSLFVPADDGTVDIYAGSQIQTYDRIAAAAVLELEPEQVRIHTQLAGGGFGRRGGWGGPNMAEAAGIFRASGGNHPIKHFQTREDDVRGGYYRPLMMHDIRGTIGTDGRISAWDHRVVGQTLDGSDGLDFLMIEGVVDTIYDLPNMRLRANNVKLPIPPMPWRGVAFNHTAFAVETFMDQLLVKGGIDPVEGRLAHLRDPRASATLSKAADMAGWGGSLPEGHALGISVVRAYRTYAAQVAEVSRDEDGMLRVHKIWCAVDCGITVNPDQVRAQMEGGIGFGLGADLFSAVTLGEGGEIVQSNFYDYRVMRMNEMPEIEVAILPSAEAPTGVGELGGPPAGAAVANAWRRLTGQVIQRLPMVSALT